jgi:hypothetical protein
MLGNNGTGEKKGCYNWIFGQSAYNYIQKDEHLDVMGNFIKNGIFGRYALSGNC